MVILTYFIITYFVPLVAHLLMGDGFRQVTVGKTLTGFDEAGRRAPSTFAG